MPSIRRRLAVLFLQIAWPLTLVSVTIIVVGGIGIAMGEPYGLGRPTDATYSIGDYIDLRAYGNAAPYLAEGWSRPTEDGRATIGEISHILLSVNLSKEHGLDFTMLVRPVFAAGDREFWVDVLINGVAMRRLSFDQAHQAQRWLDVFFSGSQVVPTPGPIRVTLVIGTAFPAGLRHGKAGSGLKIEAWALRN